MKWETTAPELLEKRILTDYPDAEVLIGNMRRDLKAQVGWPDWCWAPMSMSHAVVTRGAEEQFAKRLIAGGLIRDMRAMSAIMPWRENKTIYHFDEQLTEELTAQETMPEDIPAGLLEHLPYPCVFIASPPGVNGCAGVFCFLEWDERYPESMELRMHYLFDDGEILAYYYQFSDDQASLRQATIVNNASNMKYLSGEPGNAESLSRLKEILNNVSRHLSMLMYLCSAEPDIERRGEAPRQRTRGPVRVATHPDHFDVGSYIGGVIRMSRKQDAAESYGEGSAKRPHMRRAHWHLYWTGEGRKVPQVKWISAIFVHKEAEEIPVTRHEVKE